MKQDILEALKPRFEGVSDKILGRIADKLARTAQGSELEPQDIANGVTLQQVLEYYGDSRATEAQQTAVNNYKKKLEAEQAKEQPAEPATADKGGKTPVDQSAAPAWAQALLKQTQELADKIKTIEEEKVEQQRRQELDALTASLPKTLQQSYRRIRVNDYTDEDFDNLKEDVAAEVAQIAKETGANSAVFGAPSMAGSATTNKTASEAEAAAVVDALKL